jgi:hypothetical protein
LLSDLTALSQNLARRPREEPLTMDPGAVSAFQGILRAAQAKGAMGAIVPGPLSGPDPRITAAMERARRRPARQLQVRQSEELVEQFLQEVARKRRPTRERLTGEVAEALAVLQAAARQITAEPADRWSERRAAQEPPLWLLRLTPDQVAVLNRLLRDSTGTEAYLWRTPAADGSQKVGLRDGTLGHGTVLHGLLASAARSLVQLLQPDARHRIAVCQGPPAWGGPRAKVPCGRSLVASTRGAKRHDDYCSSTCKQNACQRR